MGVNGGTEWAMGGWLVDGGSVSPIVVFCSAKLLDSL